MRQGMAVAALASLVALGIGCASTTVRKNPGPHDHGVRYYLPKPYLLVKTATTTDKDGKVTPHPNMVDIELQMKPDFSEEYSVHVRAGMGINKTSITLDEGWMLKQVNFSVDSNASANLDAVTALLGNVAEIQKLKPSGNTKTTPEENSFQIAKCVQAHAVPLGYYESVIGEDGCGKKQIYGWRYVGFLPFNACPTRMGGVAPADCAAGEVYGLIFENNVMVFKRLDQIATEQVHKKQPPAVTK